MAHAEWQKRRSCDQQRSAPCVEQMAVNVSRAEYANLASRLTPAVGISIAPMLRNIVSSLVIQLPTNLVMAWHRLHNTSVCLGERERERERS
jgi:hypothetical protein